MIIRNIHWIIMITSLISIVKPEEKPVDKKLILDRYNEYRRSFARQLNVSNMWELEWDENLVERGIQMTSSYDRTNSDSEDFIHLVQGSDCRFFFTDTANKTLEKEDWFFIKYPSFEMANMSLKDDWKGPQQLYSSHIEAIYPSQKKIGCISYLIAAYGGQSKLQTFDAFCLVGPHGFAESRASIKFGPPGTDCTDGHGDDGLCVLGPGPQTLAPFKWDGDDEEGGTKKKKKKKKDENDEEYDLVLILTNAVRGSGISVVFGLLIMVFYWID
ncbi:hypothetical protein CRE_28967 [Caenorhabditis remanei]|uniref:Uncharacterized protein n=1 Tax=Caenorhabditis remanei TaxID=31234 RepID=E3N590_CAERE|nr:hypothetical protein CRE_28967 [Caenorhabditis remanei]